MNLSAVIAGDVLYCDVLGRTFYALAQNKPDEDGVDVLPITKGITYRHVTARQVKTHFRKMGRPRAKVNG